jgi:hypothetical protein
MFKTTLKQTWTIVLLSIIFLTNSCRKNVENYSLLGDIGSQRLKEIYLSNAIPEHQLFSNMQPLWNKVYSAELKMETIYEVALSNPNRIFQGELLTGKSEDTERRSNIRLVMTKSDTSGLYRSFYMSVINDGEETDLTQVHYKNTQIFTGRILFYSLKGEFINGWRYNSGKIVQSISAGNKKSYEEMRFKGITLLDKGGNGSERGNGKTSRAYFPGECYNELIPTYGVACVTVANYVNCSLYQTGNTYITYCTEGEGGGGNGGVGDPPGSGGGDGGGEYVDCHGDTNGSAMPAPCGCIGGATGIAECIIKEIKIDTSARKCLDTLSKGIISNANVLSLLRNIFSADINPNNVSGMISRISQSSDWNVVIKEGNIANETNYNGDTIVTNAVTSTGQGKVYVTFNKSYLNQATNLSVARTMIHELMHSYFTYGLGMVSDAGYQKFVEANDLLFKKNGNPLNDQNDAQHEQIANKYVNQVSALLEAYAITAGIQSPDPSLSLAEYCKDLA